MALFQCKLFSYSLMKNVNVNVTLPLPDFSNIVSGRETDFPEKEYRYQVLWLLHGFSADESDWQRFSGIERYAQEKGIAVVMPDGGNSFYTDIGSSARYFEYYTEELPKMLQNVFPLSSKKEDNFIAGLSMGGYGAFKAILLKPDGYIAAASLSGGLEFMNSGKTSRSSSEVERIAGEWLKVVYGKTFEGFIQERDDIKCLLEQYVKIPEKENMFYMCCGTDDFVYETNRDIATYAAKLGVPITFEEDNGNHDFDFWDRYIRKILDWLPICGKP